MIYHIHIYFVNPALRNKPNIYLGGGLSNRKRYSSQPQLSSSTDHLLGSADYINESADMLEKESGTGWNRIIFQAHTLLDPISHKTLY